jgi:alpha-glucosidase (family GH31 glycosyl hydrolase)/tetratricopeptide (TPR) repeat protein
MNVISDIESRILMYWHFCISIKATIMKKLLTTAYLSVVTSHDERQSLFARKTLAFVRVSVMALTLLLILFTAAFAQKRRAETKPKKPTADQQDNPVADPNATVISGNARFTVLTPQLIRMEWSENSQFEDHASFVFINRRLPVPRFQHESENGWLVLRTDKLVLRYKEGGGQFTSDKLRVEFVLNGATISWTPGMENKGNLQGTIRTLDGVKGATLLGSGLLSCDGWVLVDDSERPLFDNSEWPWAMPHPAGQRQDFYLLAYGHDYKSALFDFTRVAGKIPLPPRFAFGTWWSRYWAYTDTELEELVRGFQQHDIPLDVLVIDMDWHPTFGVFPRKFTTDPSGHRLGWTGYTWNKNYFPDAPKFLDWVHRQGLKATLNMHPASGVQPHEDQYSEMARAMGIDPETKKYVPFDIANKRFAENYFKILHHPLERQGIDFFWLDWQQEQKTSVAGVNPTWWLNYAHFTDMERRGKRPIIYHRWGGLGNHRYQIGFSGDTIAVWESLAFQPYFTATAANVGFGYWSHDIGGFNRPRTGVVPAVGLPQDPGYPELYLRWIQFGVFSPILRTHARKDPGSERRIWAYPAEYSAAMRDVIVLRYALIPYIYTAARTAHDTGISIIHPLYYDYPEAAEAYEFKDEYLFGNDMLVAPVVAPVSAQSLLATKSIWLPPGTWIEWFTGTRLEGPAKIERTFTLNEIPVYVKAGAIVPMQPNMHYTGEKPVDPLILNVFPGDAGEARLYDDAGNSLGYKASEFSWTTVRQSRLIDGTLKIEILPIEGSYPGMPAQRSYEIRLPMTLPPESVRANGANVSYASEGAAPGWRYDGEKLTTVISLPRISVKQKVEVLVKAPVAPAELLDGVPGKLARLHNAMTIIGNSWYKGCCLSPDLLIEAAQTGRRITYNPVSALIELRKLEKSTPAIIDQIAKLEVPCNPIVQAVAHLGNTATCDPALKPPPKGSIVELLLKTTIEKNVAAAVAQYHDLKTNEPKEYDFSEAELNTLGYQLLRMKKVVEAIEIFKLNVEAYPLASNTYDSLGEAYLALGDTVQAIKSYERSVELDPKHTIPHGNGLAERGWTHLIARRPNEATGDGLEFLSLAGWRAESSLYMVLVAHFGYRLQHREPDAREILNECSLKCDPTAWPYPVIRYLRNELDATALIGLSTDNNKMTEARAYIGMNLSMLGRFQEALSYFNWVRENGNQGFSEYDLAISESKYIEALSKPPQAPAQTAPATPLRKP